METNCTKNYFVHKTLETGHTLKQYISDSHLSSINQIKKIYKKSKKKDSLILDDYFLRTVKDTKERVEATILLKENGRRTRLIGLVFYRKNNEWYLDVSLQSEYFSNSIKLMLDGFISWVASFERGLGDVFLLSRSPEAHAELYSQLLELREGV